MRVLLLAAFPSSESNRRIRRRVDPVMWPAQTGPMVLSENVRKLPEQRARFGRFGARLIGAPMTVRKKPIARRQS